MFRAKIEVVNWLKQNFKIIILSVFVFGNFLIWYATFAEDRHGILTVAVLDIGQGDSIFIDAPSGNQLLLDGGPNNKVLRALSSVMPFYDRSIDLVALSHPHADHVGGLVDVMRRYDVSAVVSSGTQYNTPEYQAFENELKKDNLKEYVLHRGQRINMGMGVILDVLLPDRDVANAKPHDGMLVMKLSYGSTCVLLTGDMEKNLEDYLLYLQGADLKCDVLKVGHHGSHTSTQPEFLGAVSPKFAVISVGAHNSYGHPHQVTLDTLKKFNVQTLRTDQNGTIIFKSDGQSLSLKN